MGTWSIEGLREEGTAAAEIGWGTHETTPPAMATNDPRAKERIMLAEMGMDTWVRSWVPIARSSG